MGTASNLVNAASSIFSGLSGFFGAPKQKQEMSIFGFGAVDEFKQW
jgi:hypothetical protein